MEEDKNRDLAQKDAPEARVWSQEDLDRMIADRLNRERAKGAAALAAADKEKESLQLALDEEKANYKTLCEESENLRKALEDAKGRISGFEADQLRMQVALNCGLPYSMASRLQGTTKEELEQDAEELLSFVKSAQPVAPLRDPEVRSGKDPYRDLLQKVKGE